MRIDRPSTTGTIRPLCPTYDELWALLRLPMLQLAVLLVDRHDIAEEVVQDAFVALHRHWDDVDTPTAYLRRSVVNGCRSVLRRRRLARLQLHAALDVRQRGDRGSGPDPLVVVRRVAKVSVRV